MHTVSEATTGSCCGYKLVGDNLDIAINTRYMRSDGHQNQSLHFFNSLAVLDRVDFGASSTHFQATCNNSPLNMALSLVPSIDNDTKILHNIPTYISRVIITHMNFFQFAFSDVTSCQLLNWFFCSCSGL